MVEIDAVPAEPSDDVGPNERMIRFVFRKNHRVAARARRLVDVDRFFGIAVGKTFGKWPLEIDFLHHRQIFPMFKRILSDKALVKRIAGQMKFGEFAFFLRQKSSVIFVGNR